MNENYMVFSSDNELPEGWTGSILSDLVWPRKGKKPRELSESVGENSIPYIDIQAFERGNIRQYADATSSVIVEPGDILVVWDGARCGLVGKAPVRGALGSTLMHLKPYSILPSYLQFLLQSQFEEINTSPRGSGITHVAPELFWRLHFPIPPLAEQKRIVAKIEELLPQVNAVRERLNRASQIMKGFRQAILRAACTGELTEGWREENQGGKSAIEQLRVLNTERRKFPAAKRYRNYEARESTGEEELPNNWVWTSVDSIAIKVVDGVHKKPEYVSDGIPFITVRNLTRGSGIDFETVSYVSEVDHKQFIHRANPEQGDILVTKDGTLGVVRAIRTNRIFSIFVSVALIKLVSKDLSDYLELALSSPVVQRLMVATGSGLQHIHLRDLRNTCLPFPPLSEQQEIVHRVKAFFKLADAIEKRIEAARLRAEKLAQSILTKAFCGKLVPTEADLARQEGRSYEPASVLLERIKAEREKKPNSPRRGGSQ